MPNYAGSLDNEKGEKKKDKKKKNKTGEKKVAVNLCRDQDRIAGWHV